jgi:hypothetical protein
MDDSDAYREYRQRLLLTDGWQNAFDYCSLRDWVKRNRTELRTAARRTIGNIVSGHEDHCAETFENFSPKSPYDLPTSDAIFRPLFDQVIDCATKIGLRPLRPD